MLPSTCPPTVTVTALISALTRAPCSTVTSPLTFTSPLKLPAMWMSPSPSIFPSISRPAPMIESRESAVLRTGITVGSELPPFSRIGSYGIGVPSALFISFQIDMKILPYNKFAVAGFGNQFDYTQFPYQDAGLGAGGKIKARLDWRYVFAFARLSYLVRTATRFDISL